MLNAHSLAYLAQQIYSPNEGDFDHVLDNGSVCVGIKTFGGNTIVACRGTVDLPDLAHDFDARPFHHPVLGVIHEGMFEGVDDMFGQIRNSLTGEIAFTGHSLGCAHAAYMTGLAESKGIDVNQLFMLAPPHMSYAALPQLLRARVPNIAAYQNGLDPVPEVPLAIGVLYPWYPIAKYTKIAVQPDGWIDGLDPIEWHHVALYVRGIQ